MSVEIYGPARRAFWDSKGVDDRIFSNLWAVKIPSSDLSGSAAEEFGDSFPYFGEKKQT